MGKAYSRLLTATYAIAAAIGLACQTVLKLRFIDRATGFSGAPFWLSALLNAVLIAAVLLWTGLTLLRRTNYEYPVATARSRANDILAICSGAALVLYTVLELFPTLKITDPSVPAGRQALTLPIAVVCLVFGILAGASLILGGMRGQNARHSPLLAILNLTPALWGALTLFSLFNRYKPLVTVPEHLLWILFLITLNLFFMAHARIISGLGRKDGRNYVIPSGFAASLLGLLLAVPTLAAELVSGHGFTQSAPSLLQIMFILAACLYALFFTLHFMRSIREV